MSSDGADGKSDVVIPHGDGHLAQRLPVDDDGAQVDALGLPQRLGQQVQEPIVSPRAPQLQADDARPGQLLDRVHYAFDVLVGLEVVAVRHLRVLPLGELGGVGKVAAARREKGDGTGEAVDGVDRPQRNDEQLAGLVQHVQAHEFVDVEDRVS
ncbi:hypothetical protein PG984_015950 [Apiospora sp. TS-2023a]